jgi:stage II sporulation protein AB (anti-sigma F factor)
MAANAEGANAADAGRRSLKVSGGVEQLAALRAFVRDVAAEFGAQPGAIDDLVQAVDEAACNIVIHGYANRAGDIEAEAQLRDGRVEIRLLDRGRDFDPTAVRAPDLETHPIARRPGGMGVHLMRLGTDAVHHRRRAGGGNELTLVRSLGDAAREE